MSSIADASTQDRERKHCTDRLLAQATYHFLGPYHLVLRTQAYTVAATDNHLTLSTALDAFIAWSQSGCMNLDDECLQSSMGFVVGSLNRLYTLSMSLMASSESSMSKAPMFSCITQTLSQHNL